MLVGQVPKVHQQLYAELGGDAFGVELYTIVRPVLVPQCHDQLILLLVLVLLWVYWQSADCCWTAAVLLLLLLEVMVQLQWRLLECYCMMAACAPGEGFQILR